MKFDAVIVLANQMDVNGVLNYESKARAIKAVEVFYEHYCNYLVTSGWNYRNDTIIKIADAFKEYIATDLGVSKDKILTEPNSRDTVGDAYFTKINLAKPFCWKSICVVTSEYHVARTQEIFNFVYGCEFDIQVFSTCLDTNVKIINNELSSIKAFRDTFFNVQAGDDKSILGVLRERHPFYNGAFYQMI
jgi:hypothetical protein